MKKPQERNTHRTWIEIDRKAIEKNTKTLKSLLGEKHMMAVVKSNAYGHGMIESARAALAGGASWLAVDELAEAIELRENGLKVPILVLGHTLPSLFKAAADKKISLTVSSLESLQNLAKTKLPKKLRIHIKFDTGLHRQGILETHLQQAMRVLGTKGFPAILEGAYTHFAAMEDPMRRDYSDMQARTFRGILDKLRQKGFAPLTHASASSGILFSKDFHFDMARAGIALYGLWPSPEIRKWSDGVELSPALSWKSIVSEVKLVNKGAKVGYDLTYEAPRNSRLAVVPVGYWHGLPRSLSNKGKVLIRGKKAAIVGRISMDMAVVDVTDIPSVRQGDEVVLIGSQDRERMSAEEVAEAAGSINYEIVTRINPLIPRLPR
ncbi:MAG TPA: alanine racemase [Candidatus Paceibacterota bacterium]|nr:alanine racemase [Candidatus Paceibacterota bacterium]